MARIVRIKVFHEGTFRALLHVAESGAGLFRYRGRTWRPIKRGYRFRFYRRAPDPLLWIQQRVEAYEFSVFSRLLAGHCGRDGVIRPHTRLIQGPSGAHRPHNLGAYPVL